MSEPSRPSPESAGAQAQGASVNTAPKRLSRAAASAPPVKLDVYEGPLDLLLDLIRKQQINVYDIPIAKITQQYLDYLHLLEELNIDVAGEFIFMAATLIYIKSRMLLPLDPTAPPEELEDPRADLIYRLLEHEKFKIAAEMLQSKRLVEEATWSQPGIEEFQEAEDEPGIAVSVFDLISTFREILQRARTRPQIEIRREEVTVAQMIEHVREVLLKSSGPVPLEDMIARYSWRQALIALLLALLELVRLRAVVLRQKEVFAPITVHKTGRFESVVSRANTDALQAGLEESFS